MHDENSFITLTYDNEHLPEDHSLDKKHHQDFMKRLRKFHSHKKIRFFHCGEYGEQFKRPHYHTLLFGLDFADRQLLKIQNGNRIYTSDTLRQIWGKGHVSIGDVTFQSAGYVARYITKKITGDQARDHYEWVDHDTGEIHQLAPEYTMGSRKPGIGQSWFEKYKSDLYPGDHVVMEGKKYKIPRYYDKLLEREDPEFLAELKEKRRKAANNASPENTSPRRLKAREEFKQRQAKRLARPLE